VKRPKRAPILTLEGLETWFDTVQPPAHSGPVFLLPNDWMWYVIGDHEERADIGNKTQAVIDTIVDHYNHIAHQLTQPGKYAPIYMRTDEEEVLAGPWADGFFGAINLKLEQWAPLFADKRTGEPILTILLNCTDPKLIHMISAAVPTPSEAMLKEAWRALPHAVEDIYAFCKPLRFNSGAPANEA